MSTYTINLISFTARKWDLESRKIAFVCYYVVEKDEESLSVQVSILQPAEMVEELLGKLKFACEKKFNEKNSGEAIEIEYGNNSFIRQKLFTYFKRISFELNNKKRKPGVPPMIRTTHLDIYNQNQDITFLPPNIQFFVVLSWVRFHYDREEYSEAIGPLQKLIQLKPDFGIGYKWLARSLKKTRKFDEATHYYEKYAEIDGSLDSLLDLAKAYRKGRQFKKSEEIYSKILKAEPENLEARFGNAQILYALKNPAYMKILDELYQTDAEWLKQWLLEEFNFRIYVQKKAYLPPVHAARFLGYDKVFELTQLAFKNQVPSHFNPARAKISFYREEIENWAKVMNRFNCLDREVKLYPEQLKLSGKISELPQVNHKEVSHHPLPGKRPQPVAGKSSTLVEDIIMKIRASKGLSVSADGADTPAKSDETGPVKKRRGRPPKKAVAEPTVAEGSVSAPEPAPRKQGRPRKSAESVDAKATTVPKDEISQVPKRGRGRPPKKSAVVEETPKKRRGRPPKISAVVEEAPKKRRGRPPKIAAVVEEPSKKRRGRPPKNPITRISNRPVGKI